MPRIPVYFVPRDYQLNIWDAFVEKRTHKRGALIWPRRHGKDLTCLNIMAYHALLIRPGNYYYFAPSYSQGEKIIWDGKTKEGTPFLSCFPGYPYTVDEDPTSTIKSIDRRKMKIHLTNGSMFQVVGASDEDSVVGTNPVGAVFTEFSVQNPRFWDYMLPILIENDGWALFAYTIRGRNHGWRLYEATKDDPNWHTEFRTVETGLHNGKRVVSDESIEQARRTGWPEDMIRQEFYNDPYASNIGAYYTLEMRKALEDGRIGTVPWIPEMPVHTSWDIGHGNRTVIWFFQVDNMSNINVIDLYAGNRVDSTHYFKVVRDKPYVYGTHFGPHDLRHKNFQTGKSNLEVALQHGLRFVVVPKLPVEEGISATASILHRCRFDAIKCDEGIEALRQYSREDTGVLDIYGKPIYRDTPKKDGSDDYADAFRYLAIAVDRFICNNYETGPDGEVVEINHNAFPDDYNCLEF